MKVDLDVCEFIVKTLTRIQCRDPGCGCDPQALVKDLFKLTREEPGETFLKILRQFHEHAKSNLLKPSSFEFGIMMGVTLAAASDHPSIRKAAERAADILEDVVEGRH